ncbi:phosphopantetheine-binding protein [Agriterribacter sp.]|mgnify:CR=1 FL=1|uniref:phosphopantetheine-binding protein n=1 Tax=Agriterribacter sp. TaxID=2821509 RepID=UPI002D0381E7|nr:phosphopantetheine-binding protein [Agriterribacter sp.]HRO48271.1 phosphopantetheine-binding protein [Agriterribacter sp.]HRQ18088.1 phosphopantetheine-binding protein [Agriterribacter sp.]
MEKNQFLQSFAEQFDETDPSVITFDTEFKELEEWSSMVALMIIAMVDENYNKKLTGADLRETRTIEQLFDRIVQNKPA